MKSGGGRIAAMGAVATSGAVGPGELGGRGGRVLLGWLDGNYQASGSKQAPRRPGTRSRPQHRRQSLFLSATND
jgi:hypothetical protein